MQFEGDARIRQIKLLSHECKIAKKMEIYIGQIKSEEKGDIEGAHERLVQTPITYKNCQFKRIGYLSLNSNEENNFRARELKSVQLDLNCCFIKLSLQECYINDFNLYNQVGLVAVQFIGEVITRFPKILGPLIDRDIPSIRLEDLKPEKNVRRELIFFSLFFKGVSLMPVLGLS